ncbi:NAD-dependent epimerase/dehydratase family protein [Haloplanus sp. GCM10025708]|uniref:NAD-dependent epimerase/dehydratase family protein n=1 Tax=Haloferacaceae TaxID=1644056 RepID=UPI0036113D35
MPDRILVTGGAGFVGSHVAEFYAERGTDVTVVDNLSRADTLDTADEARATGAYNWNYLQSEYPDVDLVEGDVRDAAFVEDVVAGHDGVVHTAGQVAVTASLSDPRTDFEVNAEGTFNVLEGARKADSDPAVVFASTNKVYGDNVNEIPIRDEGDRYWYDDPDFEAGVPESLSIDQCEHTPYGVSKLAADLYVQDYAERNEIDAAAFRMSCIYGPRQFGNEDQGWVAHFILSTLRDEGLTIFGDGKQVRDVLYVEDLVRAYDAFLSDPEGKSTVYNVGGGVDRTTSLLELLDLLEDQTGKRTDITFDEWREGDQKVYVSDVHRAKHELDWEPRISLSEGVSRYLSWHEDCEAGL